MTLDDICTPKPDWEVVAVYHDWLIDHDQPLEAEALMWLMKNNVWPTTLEGTLPWHLFVRAQQNCKMLGYTNTLPAVFSTSGNYELIPVNKRDCKMQDVFKEFIRRYILVRDKLTQCYTLNCNPVIKYVPAYN